MAATSGRPRICIQNHISFIDIVFGATVFPPSVVGDVKMMVSNHLFSMPVIGTLAEAMGHLKVPFKSQEVKLVAPESAVADQLSEPLVEEVDFSVDGDEMKKTKAAFDDWVSSGKVGAYYPEGRTNPNPSQLKMFRAGGFHLPATVDCEIWCLVTLGNEMCWSRKGFVGGKPCRISQKLFRLCESSLALVAEAGDQNPGIFLANAAQARMQAELDKLIAEGWAKTEIS